MINIIKQLFENHNFQNTEEFSTSNNQVLFMRNLKKESVNFYLILFKETLDSNFLESEMPDYYNKINNINGKEYDVRIDKNLSLIIFLKHAEGTLNRNIMNEVFKIEEDPYYFKKYVCVYTENQEKEFKELLSNTSDENIGDILKNYVRQEESFLGFKKDSETENLYKLCITLFLKIPFLVLPQQDENIHDLQQQIKDELTEKELLNINNKIGEFFKAKDFNEELEKFLLEEGI